jgi:glyoxylase-like metal-dependent hydrolase (beta-lactamase superfamily II)
MRTHSRRGFLKNTLGACWTGAALLEQAVFRATQARAMAADAHPTLFNIEKVADGVYAAIARPQVLLNCNAAIFENSSDLLIVDTHSKPSAVIALVAQIRREVSPKPVRYIVNSHFHWDHTQGTPAYRRTVPSADVISSEATRVLLSENGAARLRASLEQTRKMVDEYKQKSASAKMPADRQFYASSAREAEAYLAEMQNYKPELPNVTFTRDLIIHDRAHDLFLAFRGRAHTGGDVVVWSPQKKVVATGDMLHGFAPFIADGYPKEWPITLLNVAEFPFEHAIGGHAGVQHTRERLYQKGAYIDELAAIVGNGKRAGKSLAQIQADNTPATIKSLQGSYRDFLLQAPRYMVQEPSSHPEDWLIDAVKTNLADVYTTIEKS